MPIRQVRATIEDVNHAAVARFRATNGTREGETIVVRVTEKQSGDLFAAVVDQRLIWDLEIDGDRLVSFAPITT